MNKKMMLLALAAVSAAMFALPAVASAGTWHLEPASGSTTITFTSHGGTAELRTTSGQRVHCTGNSGSGHYENTTTGTIELTFSTCTGPFGAHCTTSGQAAGTIKTTKLPFHNIALEPADKTKIGVLITSATGGTHFASFSCLGINTAVTGNGIIGEVTAPKCGESKNTGTLVFAANSAGHQKWTQVTTSGTIYDLTSFGSTSSIDAVGT